MEIASFISDFETMPKKIQQQVIAYFESLVKRNKKSGVKHDLNFDWENGLSELKNEYTSVELQHQANELR